MKHKKTKGFARVRLEEGVPGNLAAKVCKSFHPSAFSAIN